MPIVIAIFIVIGAFFAGNSIVNHQTKPAVTLEEIKAVTEKVKTTLSPSPTLISTPSPSFTPIPKSIITSDPDPVIKCRFPHSGVKELRKSQCDIMVDCQVGNGWIPATKDNCNNLQQSNVSNNQQDIVNCETQSGWVRMSQDDCKKLNAESANQLHEELNNQFKIHMYQALEQEANIDSTLDQLDNLRERIRHIQTSSPEEQNYVNTLIRFIEARIKILQQQ